jgi:hypothetical protein
LSAISSNTTPNATSTTPGKIRLAGDLGGTALNPTILDGKITTSKIADGAVTLSKIGQSSATTGQVIKWNGTSWVADSDISGSDATTTTKGIVQLAGDLDGTAELPTIGDGKVTSAKIADGTIATADIKDAAVTSAKIVSGAVTTTQISDGTIATADIADGAISSAKIADGTISNSEINSSAAIGVSKLEIGSADQILMSNGTGNKWVTEVVETFTTSGLSGSNKDFTFTFSNTKYAGNVKLFWVSSGTMRQVIPTSTYYTTTSTTILVKNVSSNISSGTSNGNGNVFYVYYYK